MHGVERGGNSVAHEEGWLRPVLFKYFDEAPAELFVKAEALKG